MLSKINYLAYVIIINYRVHNLHVSLFPQIYSCIGPGMITISPLPFAYMQIIRSRIICYEGTYLVSAGGSCVRISRPI